MKIDSSNVQMIGVSEKVVKTNVTMLRGSVMASRGGENGKGINDAQKSILKMLGLNEEKLNGADKVDINTDDSAPTANADGVETDISAAAKNLLEEMNKKQQAAINRIYHRQHAGNDNAFDFKSKDDYRLQILEQLIWSMSGGKGKKPVKKPIDQENSKPIKIDSPQNMRAGNPVRALNNQLTVQVTDFNYFKFEQYEKQAMSFEMQSTITTQDGRTFNLDMMLNMSEESYTKFESLSMTTKNAILCDPLILNFDLTGAKLSDQKFEFDLDFDGKSDQISRISSNSGFLALDKNGDGEINNGSELFGASSGDGFKDLAEYDSDGNNWIDENDEIFDKLRIWFVRENGESELIGLGEAGVGAVYLGNVSTQFDMNGEQGDLNGVVRKTGFFLNENGSAGTVQHIDFTI